MTATWPALVDRLVTVIVPALMASTDGWADGQVYDGPPVTQDAPQSFVTVGFVLGEDNAGSYEQLYQPGGLREENGSVLSEIVCTSGDTDLKTVRTRAFALADAWSAAVSSDGTLGGVVQSSSIAVDVQPINAGGATQRLTVTLSYTALGL
jgi:hypothetical protein